MVSFLLGISITINIIFFVSIVVIAKIRNKKDRFSKEIENILSNDKLDNSVVDKVAFNDFFGGNL